MWNLERCGKGPFFVNILLSESNKAALAQLPKAGLCSDIKPVGVSSEPGAQQVSEHVRTPTHCLAALPSTHLPKFHYQLITEWSLAMREQPWIIKRSFSTRSSRRQSFILAWAAVLNNTHCFKYYPFKVLNISYVNIVYSFMNKLFFIKYIFFHFKIAF